MQIHFVYFSLSNIQRNRILDWNARTARSQPKPCPTIYYTHDETIKMANYKTSPPRLILIFICAESFSLSISKTESVLLSVQPCTISRVSGFVISCLDCTYSKHTILVWKTGVLKQNTWLRARWNDGGWSLPCKFQSQPCLIIYCTQEGKSNSQDALM